MSTIATQCYNKIISRLTPEEIDLFNQTWVRKTQYPTPSKWHTEWYCNTTKQTFSLLHEPMMKDVKIQKKGEIILDAMTFFDDDTVERYVAASKKNMLMYDSNKLLSNIPGQEISDKALNIGTMFLGSMFGEIPLVGVYSKKNKRWIHKNELAMLRLTKNYTTTTIKQVLICDPHGCKIVDDFDPDLYMPTLIYY